MKQLAKREIAKRSLKRFIQYTKKDFVLEEFHDKAFDALERVENGELKRLMIFLPPRAGKTEIISKRFPAYILGKHPEKNIVCCSYGSDLANEFGRKAKGITQTQEFKDVFKGFSLADDKREGGNWETKEGGGYYSVGVGGALTGRGFDIGIIDDPVKNREDAESLVIRDKVFDWYTSTFYTRQQGLDSAIVIIMTRWNTDDLAGRILEAEPDKWEVISLPAIEDGKALCNRPGFGLEFYEQQRNAIGVRDFSALYQQDPIASTGQTFKKEDFRYFALSDLKKEDFTVSISVDPAFSTRDSSDNTGITVTARHKQTKEIYVIETFGEPLLPSEAWSYILSLAEKWKDWTLDHITIEEVSLSLSQQDFLRGFESYMREQGKFYTLLPFTPRGKGKKEDRIKFSLEPMFNRHAIYLRNDTKDKYMRQLEEQILKFPANRNHEFDLIDSLSQSVSMWNEREVVSTQTTGVLQERLLNKKLDNHRHMNRMRV